MTSWFQKLGDFLLSGTLAINLTWAVALAWTVAALVVHDAATSISAIFAFGFSFGTMVLLAFVRSSKPTPDGLPQVRLGDLGVIVGVPFVLLVFAQAGLRGQPPLGWHWGLAAAAGWAVGGAMAFSLALKRAEG